MSAHKRHTLPQRVYNGHRNGAIRGWYFLDHAGVMSRADRTEQQARLARLAARQEANRSGFERRRELAQARQKAEEARKQAREAERRELALPPVLAGLATTALQFRPWRQQGQLGGAIYGPIKQGTRQRTQAGKGRR
jgi:hypothetical protein